MVPDPCVSLWLVLLLLTSLVLGILGSPKKTRKGRMEMEVPLGLLLVCRELPGIVQVCLLFLSCVLGSH